MADLVCSPENNAEEYYNRHVNYLSGIVNSTINYDPNKGSLDYEIETILPDIVTGTADRGELSGWTATYTPPVGAPTFNFVDPDKFTRTLVLEAIKSDLNLDPPPKFDKEFSGITPRRPDPVQVTDPGNAPAVDNVILPPDLILKTIPDPTILDITLPEEPGITLPEFTAKAPTDDLQAPGETFSWSEESYDSALLQRVQNQINTYFNGGTGIPDAIWKQIWDKGREREDLAASKFKQDINEDWAARGFSLPQGVQVARTAEALQAVLAANNSLSRDIAIKQAELEIENLKFAVQQGIALENILGGFYQQQMSRMFEAAKYSYQATIEIFNAQVSLFNSRLELYKTEAGVYQQLLAGELAKLEIYKSQLEGQKLIGQLNQQEVEIYNALWNGLQTEADVYKTRVEAALSVLEVNKLEIEAYRTNVQAFGERIKKVGLEYDAYKTEADVNATLAKSYDSEVNAFSTRMEAYKTETETGIVQQELKIKSNDQKIQEFAANLEKHNANIQTATEAARAQGIILDSSIKAYEVKVGNVAKALDYDLQVKGIDISYAGQLTQANIQNAKSQTQASADKAQLAVENQNTVSKIRSQLTASALSSVNIGARISDSVSKSCSTSFRVQE